MIHEIANREVGRHLGRAADVVEVVVRRDEVVDLLQTRVRRGGGDAPGVNGARMAGIDEHRLAGRRNQQRGGAAFDVDVVDVQRAAVLHGRVGREGDAPDQEQPQPAGAHCGPPSGSNS